MEPPLILYSTQSWLAYQVNQRYYFALHWVWCSPYRGFRSTAAYESTTPPSSSPLEIYRALHYDVARGDRNASKIDANREGLIRGAEAKLQAGTIDEATRGEIVAVVKKAETRDFAPLLYVIPFAWVQEKVQVVPVEDRAHPLSEEYRIDALERYAFDVIEFAL